MDQVWPITRLHLPLDQGSVLAHSVSGILCGARMGISRERGAVGLRTTWASPFGEWRRVRMESPPHLSEPTPSSPQFQGWAHPDCCRPAIAQTGMDS